MATQAFKSGIAVIINIDKFEPNLHLKPRQGSELDASSLYQRCQEIGFETEFCPNPSFKEMKEKFNEVKGSQYLTNADCLLIVVTTYGKEGRIYATDHEFDINTVVEEFSSENCPQLASKPKIFIFEASKFEQEKDPNECDAKGSFDGPKGPIPDFSEYFVGVNKTKERLIVVKESKRGETFSRILANEFENVKNGEDIETLLNRITQVKSDMVMDGHLEKKLVLKPNKDVKDHDITATA